MIRQLLLVLFVCNILYAQGAKYPFPQNVTYPYGTMTKVVTNEFVKSWYDNWKKTYLQQCEPNTLRPGVDPLTKSLVEAQGFSMVAVAYMGDKGIFDSLYAFYVKRCSSTACGFMDWKVYCDRVVPAENGKSAGFGSATDGDIDVACALVVASWQWPDGGYLEKAKALISKLETMITTCSGKLTLYPGCNNSNWGGCNETDISYYAPAFFRYFAKISGNADWTKLADDTHIIRDAAANATTGLVPDWQSVSGTAGAGSRIGYYAYDAIRAPYKQSMDYLWNGTASAGVWSKKITTWAFGKGVSNIKSEYELNGTERSSGSHSMAVVGALGVAAMANSQDVVDAFAGEMIKLKDDYWYSGYLGNLYLLAISGNMWNPDIISKVNTVSKNVPVALSNVKVKTDNGHELVILGIKNECTVTLSSLSGKQIISQVVNGTYSDIDISSLNLGCYIITISDVSGSKPERKIISLY
jgi:endo-1,4-beta-D-glucanase Y